MKRNFKIALSVGISLTSLGIILEFLIRTMSGDIIELRTLRPVIAVIVLLGSGLITIGVVISYNQFRKKKQ